MAVVLSLSGLTPASAEPVSAVTPAAVISAAPAVSVAPVAGSVVRVVAPSRVVVRRESPTVLRVSWSKVPGVGGYRLYVKKDGKYVAVSAVRGKALSYRMTGLTSNTTYMFRVRAVKKVAGKKVVSGSSYWVSANTWTKKAKFRNAPAPWRSEKGAAVVLSQLESVAFGMKLPLVPGKKLVSKKLRYISLTPSMVKTSLNGQVTAGLKTGVGKVRVISHTGLSRVMTVKVVNDAMNQKTPASFGSAPAGVRLVWKTYRRELGEIASYLLVHRPSHEIRFSLNASGNMVVEGKNVLPKRVTALISKLLDDSVYPLIIELYSGSMLVRVGEPFKLEPGEFNYEPTLTFGYGSFWFFSRLTYRPTE